MPNYVTVSIISLPYKSDPDRLAGVLGRAAKRAALFVQEIDAGRFSLRGFNQVSFYLGSLQRVPFRRVYINSRTTLVLTLLTVPIAESVCGFARLIIFIIKIWLLKPGVTVLPVFVAITFVWLR